MEEGSGDLGPHYVNLYENFTRANEIAKHIELILSNEQLFNNTIMAFIPCDKKKTFGNCGGS